MTITVDLTPEARAELAALPREIRVCLVDAIRQSAPRSHQMMILLSWTFECPEHCYRVIKNYTYPPGFRIIYHHTDWRTLVIDRICRRDLDPYRPRNN